MILHPQVIDDAKQHALREFPKESCGLVVGERYIPCFNYAADPEKHFVIAPEDYISAGELTAVLHSHPMGPAHPSHSDMQGQVDTNVPWGIILTDGERAGDPIMWGDGLPIPDLLGRPFVHGINDCYSLVRDYYRTEHNLLLPNVPREDAWWTVGENLYMDQFTQHGFYKIAQSEVKPGDGFLCKIRSDVPNHAGIYIGNDLILHHLPNRLSRREPAGLWARAVDVWLRHKDLNQ